MVNGYPRSDAEVTRQTVYQNIRRIFELLQTRVYVFQARIELKRYFLEGGTGILYEDDAREDSIILPLTQGEG